MYIGTPEPRRWARTTGMEEARVSLRDGTPITVRAIKPTERVGSAVRTFSAEKEGGKGAITDCEGRGARSTLDI